MRLGALTLLLCVSLHDANVRLVPSFDIPKCYYVDDHHYNEFGYKIWGWSAALALIEMGSK